MKNLLSEKIYKLTDPFEYQVSLPAKSTLIVNYLKGGSEKLTNEETTEQTMTITFNLKGGSDRLFCILIDSKGQSSNFISELIDPTKYSEDYAELLKMIDDIDQVLDVRIRGGGVYSTTINNKSLISESMTSLENMRIRLIKRANALWSQMNDLPMGANGKPIKSVTTFSSAEYNRNRGTYR